MNKKAIVMMLVLILLVSSLLLPSSINVKGKTNLYVDQNNPQYYGSITSAIENASTGDTIFVYDGIY